MQLYLKNIQEQHIIIFDIEYDRTSLVQLAFLILTKSAPNIFSISKSINFYVKPGHPLSNFFIRYTHITDEFICDNGIDLAVARSLVEENLLDVDIDNCVIISHGIKNDMDMLEKHGIMLANIKNRLCTYNMARKLLRRSNKLSLFDVSAEGGYYMFDAHNAYADVWGTLHAFCYLQNLEPITVGGKKKKNDTNIQ